MKEAIEVATLFVRRVAAGDTGNAYAMLTQGLASDVAASDLQSGFEALADDMGGVTGIGQAMVMLEQWPGKSEGDLAIVYVPLEGDAYSEAVTLTVSEEAHELRIAAIEWGRP